MSAELMPMLDALKRLGPQSAASLAQALGLSTMGAHKQLQQLLDRGWVRWADEVQGVGRPKRRWRLSEAGHARYPDSHGELTLSLIRHVESQFGTQAVNAWVTAREQDSLSRYLTTLHDHSEDLHARLQILAALRTEEGYVARLEPDGADWLLIEDHCPICRAARHCEGLCGSELLLFQRCVEGLAEVQRSEHLLAGARRCVYRFVPLGPGKCAGKS